MNLCKEQLSGKMPVSGETRRGREIGYKYGGLYKWVACGDCGKERWVLLKKGHTIPMICSSCFAKKINKSHWGSGHPRWKGGRVTRSDGYIEQKVPPDDFFYPMVSVRGYVLEHRLVMAKHLGRCLQKWEVVHHRDGNQVNNVFENLELLPHGRFHIVDLVTKSHIKRLEKRVRDLEEELASLKEQNV